MVVDERLEERSRRAFSKFFHITIRMHNYRIFKKSFFFFVRVALDSSPLFQTF